MKPFLYQVASLFYSEYGAEVSRLAFVFPNRRTGLFFQKYLSEVSEKPLFSPTILTINDLFVQLSGKQAADRISMLFKLYDIYLRHSGSSETFDEFLYWGEMLLNDFDDIDKYMADARMLFTNVTDLREIENDFSFLSPEQIAAIRTFWSSFYPKGDTPNQEQFLAVWQILYALYTDLREALATEGKGYEGMIFREVVEQMEKDECCDLPYTKVVFVGLNALSVAEERFLSGLQKRGIADFYWDYASPKVTDPDNKASYFVERNLRQFPSQLIENGQLTIDNEDDDKKKIEVIGIPSGIGQAKQVCSILNELCKEDEMSAEEALRTAVILPDEHLLIPVLNAIPEQIKRINVTMGYPLAGTPVASLMEYILALQKNIRYVDRRPVFYFRDVLPILNHRYISTTSPEVVSNLVKNISENNKIYISYDDLNKTPLLSILFTPVTAVETFSDYLINVLQELNKAVEGGKLKVESVNSDTEPLSTFNSQLSTINDIEQEFIFHYFATVNRMKEVMREANVEMKIDTYFRLLKRVTDTITIPFHGEPAIGMQVMGVLETRNLDFRNIILLSLNEGQLPKSGGDSSFIPYNLRKAFGMTTIEHKNAVYAYYFYRLIQRAENITLLYNTSSDGLNRGEESRFMLQLLVEGPHDITREYLEAGQSPQSIQEIQIEKTPEVLRRIYRTYDSTNPSSVILSPSALNAYLDCRLRFYYRYVAGLKTPDEVSAEIDSALFGTIFHLSAQLAYTDLTANGKMIQKEDIERLLRNEVKLQSYVDQAFKEELFKVAPEEKPEYNGIQLINSKVIVSYLKQLLRNDLQYTPFEMVAMEKKVSEEITIQTGQGPFTLRLGGTIDRMDAKESTLRIVDYKTGGSPKIPANIEQLFTPSETRPNYIFQTFLYAAIMSRKQSLMVAPALLYIHRAASESYSPVIEMGEPRKPKIPVNNFAFFEDEFRERLQALLEEIFNEKEPFMQTEDTKKCSYCDFKAICKR